MARYTGGWFKAWRDAWGKDLSQNQTLWALWNALLHMATWKESKVLWEGQQRMLPPGSVVFGVSDLANQWGVSRKTILKWAKYLHDTGRIVLETSPRGTLATICNWELYQATIDAAVTLREHNGNTEVTPGGTYEEVKKEEDRERSLEKLPECLLTWEQTLQRLGISKKADLDKEQIARLIQRHGIEKTKLALLGAGFEEKSEGYDPKKHVSIYRLTKPAVFDKFVNLGAQNQPAVREAAEWGI